jgi:demethylmenaquinone methyltransferase / 2-methoxy-6-polyprenyl-1,4-benzoquinol methylase
MIKKEVITPYQTTEPKKTQIKKMFDGIAPSYDFLNRFLSLGIDIGWRKKSLDMLIPYKMGHLLDIATGTGDFALMASQRLKLNQITAIDLSPEMLAIGRSKTNIQPIDYVVGDAEELRYPDNTFDGATVAFGVRNFEDLQKGLCEIYRCIRPGAPFLVLEFSKVERFPMKQLFYFYSRYMMPTIGKLFSMDFNAYKYLHESMHAFPSGIVFVNQLERAGFQFVKLKVFSFGICTAYLSAKPGS